MIRTPKPICRHPLENMATITLTSSHIEIYTQELLLYYLRDGTFGHAFTINIEHPMYNLEYIIYPGTNGIQDIYADRWVSALVSKWVSDRW